MDMTFCTFAPAGLAAGAFGQFCNDGDLWATVGDVIYVTGPATTATPVAGPLAFVTCATFANTRGNKAKGINNGNVVSGGKESGDDGFAAAIATAEDLAKAFNLAPAQNGTLHGAALDGKPYGFARGAAPMEYLL